MKTAIVGCGQISREHVAALQALTDVELVAVVDVDRRRAAEVARMSPGTRSYSDVHDLRALMPT